MSIYAIGVFASLILYVIIGNYVGTKVKHLDDYFVVGRNAPTVLILGTLVASFLSTNAFMGETGFAYSGYVIPLLILIVLNASGYVVGALYFGRYLRRSEALTVPEYFGRRFNSRKVQAAAGITTIVGITAYLLAVTQGASLLMSELLHVDYGICLLIVWATYTSFAIYAGSGGVILTDTIMFFLFTTAAFLATPFIIKAAGGWSYTISKLAVFSQKPGIISWHGLTGPAATWSTPGDVLIWAIILGIAWMGVVAVSPWQTSRYLMARNEHTVLRSAFLACISIALIYLVLAFTSAAINLINPGIEVPEKAFIWSAFNVLPAWLGIIVLAGIMAAALSSCSTFLSLIGFSLIRDIIPPRDEDEKNQKKMLKISRMMMAVAGLVALVLAYYQPPQIFWITYFSGTLFFASWGPAAFLSVWSRRITAEGAFWGIIVGFVANCASKLLDVYTKIDLPVYLDPIVIGLVLGTIALVVASALTRVTPEEEAYRQSLFNVPEVEKDPREIKRTLAFPKLLVGVGVVISVILLFMYAIPYTRALVM